MLSKVSSFFSSSPRRASQEAPKVVGSDSKGSDNEMEKMTSRKPRTLNQMLRYRAQSTPNSPLLTYPVEGTQYVSHTAAEIDKYVQEAAEAYSTTFPQRRSSNEKPTVVALLGLADLDYVVTMFALYRLGHTVVAMSPRLAQNAYEHLIEKLDVRGLIYHPTKSKMAETLNTAISNIQTCEIVTEAEHKSSKKGSQDVKPELDLDMEVEGQNIAVVIHSSGSTGLPKPIKLSHDTMVMAASKNMDMTAFSCVPFFHGFGLNGLHRGIYAGREFLFYNASLPLTSKHLENSIMQHDFNIFFCVPYALKLLADTETGMKALEKCRFVWFAGSACPDELGDLLTKRGVKVISDYGLSECGPLMTTMRPDDDHAWNYLRPLPHNKPYMTFEERSEGHELVCHDGMPWKVASNRDDGSYATGDVFEKHPTINDAYRFISRVDDTLVLYNGEKADPSALEGKVRQQALVAEAVMFGSGKEELGLFLVASEAAKNLDDDQLVNEVWPAIVKAQKEMPEYAKIVKSMVVVLPIGTEYPRTDKGTIIRQQFYQRFSQQIEDAYAEELNGERFDLDLDTLQEFIRNEVVNNSGNESAEGLDLDTDLFSFGIDSLQSTQLRRALQSRFDFSGKQLPFNVVYENPTIRQLSEFVYQVGEGQESESSNTKDTFYDLVEQHGQFGTQGVDHHESGCVVLTGATGSLGAHLLLQLVKNEKVNEVYCLVRADSSESVLERISESLRSRQIYDEMTEDSWSKMKPLVADLAAPNFGLDGTTYRQIAMKMSGVIHAAWPVNFNMSLASFTSDIAGTKNLLDMCLTPQRSSPASFAFCSSISTLMNQDTEQPAPEMVPEDPDAALDMGYAQSKLVAENLCVKAAEQTGVKAYVMRIGQISGDTKHGVWNPSEAVPMMIQTAETIGSLPGVDEIHKWLPVDIVAATILDISLAAEAPPGSVFNIVNPLGFRWRSDLLPKLQQAGLKFDEVPVSQWLEKLHSAEEHGEDSAPLKLLSYFENVYEDENGHGRGEDREFEADNTTRYSSTFAKGWTVSQDTVEKLVQYLQGAWDSSPAQSSRERQFSSSSERTLGDDETDKNTKDTSVSGKESEPESDTKGRKMRMDSVVTLTNDERRTSDGNITWDNEAKKFQVPDLEVPLPKASDEIPSSEKSTHHEIDIEAVKATKIVGWSGTHCQFEVHGQDLKV